ncbi:hypothetical protein AAG906_003365 [Vitis piasezkii]
MHSEFEMSMMGELNFFLGLQIKQLQEGTFINQAKYVRDLLKRFNMEEAKTMKTPMSSSIKLEKDEKGKSINSTMYRGMIGSLLYLTASRLDIMYSVCLCARFQSCPKESHLSVVKRIHRYLKGTMNIGLWYLGDNFELIGFLDANFADCKVERKNTSGTCHFLRHSLVSWHSKKQNSVALSTGEYLAADLFVQSMQGKNNGERKNRVKKTEDSSCSLLLHFWSTFRSPFSTCYIPFQSSGSQESNASNSAQFGVETKELQPLQADHSKLKEDFARCEISLLLREFHGHFAQACVFS